MMSQIFDHLRFYLLTGIFNLHEVTFVLYGMQWTSFDKCSESQLGNRMFPPPQISRSRLSAVKPLSCPQLVSSLSFSRKWNCGACGIWVWPLRRMCASVCFRSAPACCRGDPPCPGMEDPLCPSLHPLQGICGFHNPVIAINVHIQH